MSMNFVLKHEGNITPLNTGSFLDNDDFFVLETDKCDYVSCY